MVFTRIDDVVNSLESRSFKNIPNYLVTNCHQLLVLYKKIDSIASLYDRPGYPKANGFRSLLKVVNKFIPNLIESLDNVSIPRKSLSSFIEFLNGILSMAWYFHENWSKETDPKVKFLWLTKNWHYTYDKFKHGIQSYWSYYPLFWLDPDIRKLGIIFGQCSAILSSLPRSLILCFSAEEKGAIITEITWRNSVFYPFSFINLVDNPLTSIISWIRNKWSGVLYETIKVPRQARWIIPEDGSQITATSSPVPFQNKLETVTCRIMRHSSHPPNGHVILHIQGGGFMIDAHFAHANYLRPWLSELPGSTVINIDYSVYVRYPVALQEVVDVILWLINRPDSVEFVLGFKPKHVTILGDSCGGYLGLAACAALRDIRDLDPDSVPLFPQSIVALSPVMAPININFTPSFLLSCLDGFLCPTIHLQILSLYSFGITCESECCELDSASSSSSVPITDRYTYESLWSNITRSLTSNYQSWIPCDPIIFEKRISKMVDKLFKPYISLLTSYNLTKLSSELSLFLITSDLDPAMDSVFEIERVWSDKINIDVLEDLHHGFYAFGEFSNSAHEGNMKCLQRLKEATALFKESNSAEISQLQ